MNKSHFLILCHEMFQHRADLSKSENRYLPTGQCMTSQASVWVQGSPVALSATAREKLTNGFSSSVLQLASKKFLLVEFWCRI